MSVEERAASIISKVGLWWPLAEQDQLRRAAVAYDQVAVAVLAARQRAIAYLDLAFPESAGQWDIADEFTSEGPDGWTFHWNSAEYIRTRDEDLLCYGAAPLWVSKSGDAVELRPQLDPS